MSSLQAVAGEVHVELVEVHVAVAAVEEEAVVVVVEEAVEVEEEVAVEEAGIN